MSGLLPLRSEVQNHSGEGLRLVGIDDESARAVFDAIGSQTTREILQSIYQEPGTASDIAERTDVSLQNAKYHIDKLIEADLIEVGENWYSEQGNMMKVYTPTNESIVMVAGNSDTSASIKETLTQLIGAIGLLGIFSYVVDRVMYFQFSGHAGSEDSVVIGLDSGGGGGITSTPSGVSSQPVPAEIIDLFTPGVIFFIGGLTVLVLVFIWNRYSSV